VSPPAGVAIGNDVYCSEVDDCERDGMLTLTVNSAALPKGAKRATVRVYAPQTDKTKTITVTISSGPGKTGVPGIVKN